MLPHAGAQHSHVPEAMSPLLTCATSPAAPDIASITVLFNLGVLQPHTTISVRKVRAVSLLLLLLLLCGPGLYKSHQA